ncbi:GNAT family N-acetyltransferase [Paenibacillus luteus]|uniref:GNAT family N-acetyltransferase n=1 Tax=Paenibacillus luteus TaxID=2545753 RepID=UPI0011427FF5|nr:GNAT family N-acetyltransferase [Paenibacillus luteus]
MEKAIEIKHMSIEHFDESMALSQFAFQYKKSADELERSKEQFAAEPTVRYAAYVDQQFAAQAAVLELQAFIGGKRFDMGGLAGVATWPEYRRQGLVAQILVQSLKEMKAKGQTVSFLHPFAFGFYRKFGWETYTENKLYTIKTEQLPVRSKYEGHIERFGGSLNELNDLYEAYASKYNGSLVRSEFWWKYRINVRKPGQIVLYYDKNGSALGYLIYEVKDYRLSVHELIYLSEQAREALWSFIAQHDSMINEITITVPSDDLLPFQLSNPRIKQEIIPYFMARIVDAEAFISQYDFEAASEEIELSIELSDEHAPWNNGCYLLRIAASGKATLSKHGENERKLDAIKLNIGSFTAMLIGYMRPLQLSQIGHIQGDIIGIKRLQERIPERTTYLPDFF